MRILVVDDERLVKNHMVSLLQKLLPGVEAIGFVKVEEALDFLKDNAADVAFLDIEMDGMDGLTLARRCRELCPHINIIFVTGHDQYAIDALSLHASGYLLKPVREKELLDELANLRYPPQQFRKKVRIQTFGNFEVFVNQRPIHMPGSKCKECLAYLVDRRGARVEIAEIASVLWEDRPYDRKLMNNAYRVVSDLMRYLREAKADDIIIKSNRYMALDVNEVDCDYYRYLEGENLQSNAFRGEYMTNYSWGEFTLAQLERSQISS